MAATYVRASRFFVLFTLLVILIPVPPAGAQLNSSGTSDATVYSIHVQENGDSTWTVELRRQLDDQQEVEAFRELKSEFEAGNVSIFSGLEESIRPLVSEASNETGRSMSVDGFNREVVIEQTVTGRTGITRVTFNWTNFARFEDGNLMVGDVFVGSGLVIGENQRLIITYDEDLTLENVVPEPDVRGDNRLEWRGQRFFDAQRPSLTLSTSGGLQIPIATVIAGVVVLVSGFFGGVYIGRRMGLIDGNQNSVEVDQELMTDEDKVLELLHENGGRMKQADIVDSTGWSKSKVSMVLSEMEDDEVISKLRLGRENVIDLENEE